MSLPVVTNPLNINLKFLEKPAKLTIQNIFVEEFMRNSSLSTLI